MHIPLKKRLLYSAIVAGLGLTGFVFTPAFADQVDQDDQVTEAEADDDEDIVDMDRVQVTGTRIRREGIDTFYPAVSVDRQLLEDGAYSNVADALNEIPSFGVPTVTPQGPQGFANLGQNFVNFLGLGAQRTLTLVNGRRFISSNTPSTFATAGGLQVDFNVIPIAIVDRIETIGIGGAPIYGSDAIAGTINVILQDRYEGVDFNLRKGLASKGDFDFEQASLTAGANTPDGRGNVVFSSEWYRQEGVRGPERPRLSIDRVFYNTDPDGVRRILFDRRINILTFGGLAHPVGSGLPLGPSPSREIPIPSFGIGRFPDGNFYSFDPSGNLAPYTPGQPGPSSIFFALGGDGEKFFEEVQQLQSPLRRGVFTASMNYDVSDSVRLTSDLLFSTSSARELNRQVGFQTGAFGETSSALVFSADNPFLTEQARGVLAANGVEQFVLSRFHMDMIDGVRNREQFVWRWSGGLDGEFYIGNRRFNWELYAAHGESDGETKEEGFIDGRFLNAINPRLLTQEDLDALTPAQRARLEGISGTPTVNAGDIICDAVYQAAIDPSVGQFQGGGVTTGVRPFIDGCVPLNLFGFEVRSQAARDWVTGDRLTTTRLRQTLYNANVGGDLFDLPAGPVAFNVGFESRRERAVFVPGLGTEVPLTRSAPFLETGGQYDTDEFFGELLVPIFSPGQDIPGLTLLELNGAYRTIDNSLAGSADVWTVGGRWAPILDVTFRANYTESIRAPSLVELFAPQTTSFSFANDPCDFRFSGAGPVPGTRQANCRAEGLDPDNFVSNVVNATARGTTGGNPNLDNESAESWSVGVTIEPRWVDNLVFTSDYYNIELVDAITALNLTAIMTACYDSTNFPNPACDGFERDATGQVIDFTTGQTNAQKFTVEVLDAAWDYRFDVARAIGRFTGNQNANWGQFRQNSRLSYTIERTTSVTGEVGTNLAGGFLDPKWQGTFDFTWTRNDLRVFWRILWQNRAKLSPVAGNVFEDRDGNVIRHTGWRAINNMSIAYVLPKLFPGAPEEMVLQLNVNNVLRRMPNLEQEAAGHFGFEELVGRSYVLGLRGRY